jgi:hypothetical protein
LKQTQGQNVKNTVRLQFEIPQDRLPALDALMEDAGIRTRTELFNNAMSLLKWAVRQRKDGRVIASIDYDGDSFRELVMPILEEIERPHTDSRVSVPLAPRA